MSLGAYIKRHRWDLAFVDRDWNFRFIDTKYSDRWFADPFILSVAGQEVVVLAEEFTFRTGKGRIARLLIDADDCILKEMEIILELDTHLSFPAIFRKDGDVFIYPENSASGGSRLYRYDDQTRKMEAVALLSETPLTDAIIFQGVPGRNLILSTALPDPNGKELLVLASKDVFSPCQIIQKVHFDDYVARNAGDVFVRDGVFVRPAQICDGGYGYGLGVEFQKMEVGKDGALTFAPLERHFPPAGYDGMHTYNSWGDVHIVDCRRFLHPGLRGFLHRIKHGRGR